LREAGGLTVYEIEKGLDKSPPSFIIIVISGTALLIVNPAG
jgi:hypothetical protein